MSSPFRLRRSLGGGLLLLLAACGGDSPAGPDDDGTGTPPEALSVVSPNVRTMEIVTVGVRGVRIGASTIEGQFGAGRLTAARLDDTTLAFMVPQVAAGEHEVRFDVGTKAFTTKLQVAPAPTVPNPDDFLGTLVDSIAAQATAIEARLAAATATTPASDTAGLGALALRLRTAADSAGTLIGAMSASERASAAAYLQANLVAATSPSLMESAAITGCDGGTVADCNAALRAEWVNLKGKIAQCTATALKVGVAVGAVGALLGAGVVSPLTMAFGAIVGTTVAGAMCVYEVNDDATQKIIVPAIVNLRQDVEGLLVAPNEVPTAENYRVKSPREVQIAGEFRSLMAADVALPGIAGEIARTVNEAATLWVKLLDIVGLSSPGPKLPAAPATRIAMDLPASMLKIGTISLAGATATTAGGDTAFIVTFQNDKQGADHSFSYTVRYEPSGRPAQEEVISGILQPERYVVATLAVDSVPSEMRVGQGTVQLHWTARDSSGAYLGATGVDSLLDGRLPAWTSDKPDVASVSSTGVVTARAEGTVTITARLETGTVSATITVYPSVVGTWQLKTLNDKPVPYSETDSLGVTQVQGGSITIRADSTFSFSYSETWTANIDGVVWDEGGAGGGTYVLNGNSISFTILEKSGDAVEEIVNASFTDGVLTVTYSGGEGGATGKLTKN